MFGIPLHKLIIHFPIALTIIAVIYDAWAVFYKKPELHKASYGLTLWAAVAALGALGTGLQLAQMIRADKAAITGHAGFAIGAAIMLCAVAGVRYSAQAQERSGYPVWWLILETAAAALVSAAAITGHQL
jgi:uncharacterized membrane protein